MCGFMYFFDSCAEMHITFRAKQLFSKHDTAPVKEIHLKEAITLISRKVA